MARHLMRLLLMAAAALVSAPGAIGQILVDPMRPPPEFLVRPGAGAGGSGAGAPQVLVLSRERREATVNGQIVRLGDRVNGARIEQISEDALVLRSDDRSRQTMHLYPGIEKKVARPEGAENNKAAKGKK